MRKYFTLLFLTCTLISIHCQQKSTTWHNFWPEDKTPLKLGEQISNELFTREAYMMYITEELTTFHYAEACAAYGVARFAGVTGDTALLEKIINRYGHLTDSGLISSVGHVDRNVYGVLPLEIYRQTGKESYLTEGIALADQQWENPLPNGMSPQTRFWIDDIYMIASLQTQAFRITTEQVYLDRAALEVNEYLKKLQQKNGLFHHGENAPFFWGRGNGWVAAGLAELISVLPEDHELYPQIIEGYTKMMEALLNYQAEDGMWRQLIDYPNSWKETSCTAMFGFALSEGVKRGILKDPAYQEAYKKAWLALCDYVDEEGKLDAVCVGTGQSTDENYYLNRPKTKGDFHGQAPMLWFAWSLLKE